MNALTTVPSSRVVFKKPNPRAFTLIVPRTSLVMGALYCRRISPGRAEHMATKVADRRGAVQRRRALGRASRFGAIFGAQLLASSLLAPFATLSTACGACALAPYEVAPIITVVDASTGRRICDATMVGLCQFGGVGLAHPSVFLSHEVEGRCEYQVAELAPDGGAPTPESFVASNCNLTVSEPGFFTAHRKDVTGTSGPDDPCSEPPPPAPRVVIRLEPEGGSR